MQTKKSTILFGLLLGITFIFGSMQIGLGASFPKITNAYVGGEYTATGLTFEEIKIKGQYAYAATIGHSGYGFSDGLRIYSLTDAANPTKVGSIGVTTNSSYSIELYDDAAYLRVRYALGVWGIEAFNISSPTTPVSQGDFSAYDDVSLYEILDDVLYVCNGSDLVSLDVSNLDSITELDRLEIEMNAGVSGIKTGLLFVSATTDDTFTTHTLELIDISDPSDLSSLSVLELGDFYVSDVEVDGDVAYCAGRDYDIEQTHGGTVKSVDISDTSDPTVLDTIVTDGISATGMYIDGDTLYTGACARGAVAIDITSPSNLKPVGYWNEYQSYCGGEFYAQHPTYYDDSTYGELLYFVSINCGLVAMSIDTLEFEPDIPGPSTALILTVTGIAIFMIVKKGTKIKIKN